MPKGASLRSTSQRAAHILARRQFRFAACHAPNFLQRFWHKFAAVLLSAHARRPPFSRRIQSVLLPMVNGFCSLASAPPPPCYCQAMFRASWYPPLYRLRPFLVSRDEEIRRRAPLLSGAPALKLCVRRMRRPHQYFSLFLYSAAMSCIARWRRGGKYGDVLPSSASA